MRGLGMAGGALFGVAHLAAALAMLRQPPAPVGSGQPGAIPRAARASFAFAAVVVIVGSFLAVGEYRYPGAALAVVGLVGVVGLAIRNGGWMHGRLNPRHHAARAAAAVVIAALLLVGP